MVWPVQDQAKHLTAIEASQLLLCTTMATPQSMGHQTCYVKHIRMYAAEVKISIC